MTAQRPQDSYPQQSAFLDSSSFNQLAAQPPRASTPTPHSSGNGLRTLRSAGKSAAPNPAANLHCFRCGEKGHFAIKCPQKKQGEELKCFYCGNLGHHVNKCPQWNLEKPARNVITTNLSFSNKELIKSPSKKQAIPAEVLLPDPEAPPDAICLECGKTGHVTQLCPPIRQDARGTCFTCGQYGHYCYTCTVPYCPYCEEHHQLEDCSINQVACTRCGEKGHQANRCRVNCPNCDEDHQPGECPMLKVTCFLCEGQDHCPKDCFLRPILTKAVELQRISLQIAARLVVNEVGKDNQYQTPFNLKGYSEIAPKCQNTSVEMKRNGNVLRTHRPAGTPAVRNPIAQLRCFNCGKRGHRANKCPQQVTPKKYNLRATPARCKTSALSKRHQTSQASRAAYTPNQSQGHVNHVAAAEAQAASGVMRGK